MFSYDPEGIFESTGDFQTAATNAANEADNDDEDCANRSYFEEEFKESAHNQMGYILIESASCVHDPMYMLYFEETIFGAGHYQSIQPSDNNQILKHYRWTKNKNLTRAYSVGEPITCSSRISEINMGGTLNVIESSIE